MEIACQHCFHVVDLGSEASRKCPNCGQRVHAPRSRATGVGGSQSNENAPGSESSASAASGSTDEAHQAPGVIDFNRLASGAVHSVPIPGAVSPEATLKPPHMKPAARLAIVCGFLFFIPFVPQVIAIIAGIVALARKPEVNERRGAAWFGLISGIVLLFTWMVLSVFGISMITMNPARWTANYQESENMDEAERVAYLFDELERLHAKIEAFHRDFHRWPDGVRQLAGRYMDASYRLPTELSFRAAAKDAALDWIVLYSQPVRYNRDGESLTRPQCIVLHLSGKTEMLLPTELAMQIGMNVGSNSNDNQKTSVGE